MGVSFGRSGAPGRGFRDHFGTLFGAFWLNLETTWANILSPWTDFDGLWGDLGVSFGRSGTPGRGFRDHFGTLLGAFWLHNNLHLQQNKTLFFSEPLSRSVNALLSFTAAGVFSSSGHPLISTWPLDDHGAAWARNPLFSALLHFTPLLFTSFNFIQFVHAYYLSVVCAQNELKCVFVLLAQF